MPGVPSATPSQGGKRNRPANPAINTRRLSVGSVSVALPDSYPNSHAATISRWAAQIIPGSPPITPSPRSSVFGLSKDNSPKQKQITSSDLLAHGYTSFVVHLPSKHRRGRFSPETPTFDFSNIVQPVPTTSLNRKKTQSKRREAVQESGSALSRLRSLSLKTSKPPPVVDEVPPVPDLSMTVGKSKQSKSKTKSTPQARYGNLVNPLAQEVAIRQALDGGSLDENIRRVAEREAGSKRSVRDEVYGYGSGIPRSSRKDAKDRRPVEQRLDSSEVGRGVGVMHRDGVGGLWRDEDEQLELAELLEPISSNDISQIHKAGEAERPSNSGAHGKRRAFLPRLLTSSKPQNAPSASEGRATHPGWIELHSPSADEENSERRGSAGSGVSGPDLDLDPARAVRPLESCSVNAAGSFVPGYSLSAAPRAPNEEAFGLSIGIGVGPHGEQGPLKRERRERRRPAPLPFPLPEPAAPSHSDAPASKKPTSSSNVPASRARVQATRQLGAAPYPDSAILVADPIAEAEREARCEFLANSFAPAVPAAKIPDVVPCVLGEQERQRVQTKAARRGSLSFNFTALSSKVERRRSSVPTLSPTTPNLLQPVHHRWAGIAAKMTYMQQKQSASMLSLNREVSGRSGQQRSLNHKTSRSRIADFFKRGHD